VSEGISKVRFNEYQSNKKLHANQQFQRITLQIKKANPKKTGSAFRFNQTSTARQIAPFYRRAINPPAS
jgi:hypothetical protein